MANLLLICPYKLPPAGKLKKAYYMPPAGLKKAIKFIYPFLISLL